MPESAPRAAQKFTTEGKMYPSKAFTDLAVSDGVP
jgi:hypothetical protein